METDTLNKVQDAERINDTRKAELLSTPIEHIDITTFDARPIIDSMGKMSFTSRDLARATGIYNQMLEDKDCSIILVIAGSTSAGGCMDLYAELVKSNMVYGYDDTPIYEDRTPGAVAGEAPYKIPDPVQ